MARMAAGVRKRSDGTLEKRFTIDGQRYSVYGKNQKELVQNEQEMRKLIEAGLYVDNKNLTLDGYFEGWVPQKRNSVKPNTMKLYKEHYNKYISPELGKRKVQQLERREILKFQGELKEKLAVTSVNAVIRVLKIILNDAVRDEVINKNPAAGIKALKVEQKATESYHRALTPEEQETFMQEMRNEFYYELVALLLCTGMRVGEAVALQWDDIDTKRNVIHINKTLTRNEDGTRAIGSPKSDSGKRDIPMNDTIKKILHSQKRKFKIVSMDAHSRNVFLSPYGNPINNKRVNGAIRNVLDRLEEQGTHIEHFTAHALRDTFATRYIEQGGNMQTLKTLLGHTSLAMTADLYSHVLPDTKQKEMNSIEIAI